MITKRKTAPSARGKTPEGRPIPSKSKLIPSKGSPPMDHVGKTTAIAVRARPKPAKKGSVTEPHTSAGKKPMKKAAAKRG